MSRRFDYAMKKGGKGRRKKDPGVDFSMKSYGVFPPESGEAIGNREGGDGAASPDVDGIRRELSGTGLPLTVHSVPVGGADKSRIGTEFVGVTDRISKLLNDYESLYEDDEASHQALQQSVTGQIYMDSLLSDYNSLCQERESLLESLHDSLDLDEEEVLDRLEKKARESAAEFEGSETIVMETFNNAKVTFEKLRSLNQDMVNVSKGGQDTTKLEQEKQMLEDELSMYKRLAVQQRMDNAYKSRRRASVVRKDETQQWKLVAGEMLDIVQGIKKEGKLDKVQLEKDLNNILMTMSNQNDTIEKLKLDLAASEKKCSTVEQEKLHLFRDMTKAQEDLDAKRQETMQYKRMVKQLQTQKKKGGAAAVPDALVVTPEVEVSSSTPVIQDTTSTDIIQAQLRDQKNKAIKFEEQNKELQEKIEAFEKESRKRREMEINVAQKVVNESDGNACSNCQILGSQVLRSRDEMDELTAKINKLQKELARVQNQLKNAQKEAEEAKKSRAKGSKKQEVASTPTKEKQTRAPPPSPTPEIVETQVQETPGESPPAESPPAESPDEESNTLLKPTKKTKPKKVERKTSSKAKKKIVKAKQPDDSAKEETPKEPKKEEIVEKKKDEQPTEKKSKEEEFSSDEKAPYVKVREAKLMTLCDTGTQTGYLGRMATMNMANRRESVGSWKASKGERKHSLTEAIMSIAPPPVVEQETSMVISNIFEEADRLCEEISGFMEYGFDLVQQQANSLQTQAEKHIGIESTNELVKESEHDVLPSIDRRLSLHGGGGGAGARRRSTILQLDTRRGSIRNRESLFPAELFGRKRASTLPEVEEEDGDKPSTGTREQEHEGVPVTTITFEDQLKLGIANMAQQAIDIIKGTGEVLSNQLNHKQGTYEKFYDMWRHLRQQRRQSLKAPVIGKGILHSVSFEKAERPSKSRGGIEEDAYRMDIEPGMLFPQIAQHVQPQTNKGTPISTAKLSNQGLMMIGSCSDKKPEVQASPQSTHMKKRGKPMTRQQQMIKQKALLEKVLHVDSRMQDIHNIVDGTSHRSAGSQALHSYTTNQSFNLPFITHGITSSQEAQLADKKGEAVLRRMSMIEEVTHSTSTWSSKDAIPKFFSTNEVPKSNLPTVTKAKARAKLPSLTISNFFK